MKDIVLVGAGKGLRDYLLNNENAKVKYVYDNYTCRKQIEGIDVLEDLRDIVGKDDMEVIVTASSFEAKFELCYELRQYNIPFKLLYDGNFDYAEVGIHIWGKYPDLRYDVNFDEVCGEKDSIEMLTYKATINLFKFMLKKYENIFNDKKIDIWMNCNDKPYQAYKQSYIRNTEHIFSYCTTYAIKDRVIAIPDYYSCYDNDEYLFEYTQKKCKEAALSSWTDSRAFFAGQPNSAPEDQRKMLKWLADKYPQYIEVLEYGFWNRSRNSPKRHYVSMLDQVKYKYLIDMRGNGWADRTKILLQLGRPVFIVERLFYDWFWDDLVPMKHYVPVKMDLSDLIEKIQYLDNNPDIYAEIVKNAADFSRTHFSEKAYLQYMKDVTLKYGVVE